MYKNCIKNMVNKCNRKYMSFKLDFILKETMYTLSIKAVTYKFSEINIIYIYDKGFGSFSTITVLY